MSLETRKLLSELKKGTTHTEETKKKISLALKKWWKNASKEKKEERSRKLSEKEKGKVISDEQRKKISKSCKGRESSTKGKMCITNNINNKYVFEDEVDYYLQLGYHLGSNQKGKIVSQETRDKLSSKLKGKPTCTLGRVRMNNGKCIKYVKKEDVPYYLNNGYVIGGPNTFNKKK